MTKDPYPPDEWPPRLSHLVASVRAPGWAGELAGEEPAVAAFRAAHAAAPPRRMFARLLAVKVLAGGVVLAAGGYAVAAATGAVPAPPIGPDRTPTTVTTTAAATPGPTTSSAAPRTAPSVVAPTRRPAPSYLGLCRAYLAADRPERANVLRTAPMRDLVAAAGGEDAVPDFCAALTTPSPGRHPSASPRPPHGNAPATPPGAIKKTPKPGKATRNP